MNSKHSNTTNQTIATSSPSIYATKTAAYSPLYQTYSSSSLISKNTQDDNSVIEYQQLYNRYIICLSQLHESVEEVDALRRENESLRLTNEDLSRRAASLFSRDRLLAEFNRMSVGGPSSPEPHVRAVVASPQPLAERNHSVERVTLPKSISVRSRGYLKMMSRGGRDPVNNREKSMGQRSPDSMTQRVFVPGAKTEEEPLEFDAYNQGMFKTELCNKWQETGACPYGENCQFAHGIKELRPVIRHPRYKTEVCRMVLVGDVCPYGHRCHFRHALTDQERLIAVSSPPPPPR